MQVAHPLIAAGVARHSGFREGTIAPVGRLRHTIHAMLDLTFGSDDEARAIVDRINGIHDRVHGTLGDVAAGARQSTTAPAPERRYSAHDPLLKAWVHLTLLDSSLRTYQLFVGPLSTEEQDRYCAESRVITEWLGVAPAMLPASVDELRAQMDARLASANASAEIIVSPEARELADAILWPPIGRWIWPIAATHRLITIGLLPPTLREAYGLPWSPRRERALNRLAAIVRAARRLAPARLAHWRNARTRS
jgi:uncharacterized protein (DUF2236 family)